MKIFRSLSALITLLFFLSAPFLYANWTPEKISFKSPEAVPLKGFFHPPRMGKPTLLMLHGLASDKHEWIPLAQNLQEKGWGVMAYDARGHGESSKTKDQAGRPNGFQQLGRPGPGSQWEKMIQDVGAAIQFLKDDKKIEVSQICLAGASLGANVILNYASSRMFKGPLILLSPGLNYQEIKTEKSVTQVTNSLLIVASPKDSYAYRSSHRLAKKGINTTFWFKVKPGHGVQMLDDDLTNKIIGWLDAQSQ